MAFEPSLAEQELLADTIRRSRSAVTGRQRFAEILVGGGFVAAVAVIWALNPPHGLNPAATLMCVAVMALSSRVRFDTPLGFTVPTQLAFVPLLFATPLALVPIAVAAALAISRLPDVVAGRVPAAKLLRALGNSWFSVGPVAVFSVAHVAPADAGPLLLIVALGAQFGCDFLVSAVYFAIARSASVRSQLRDSWVYVIDAALSCVGLVVAEQMSSSAVAVLAVVPLLGLLAMFAHERQQRLESLLELNDTYRGTALLLADVVSADDGYTGEHSRGVVGLALEVGTELGLGRHEQRNLEFGALLHDVGKISIPKEIINKPGKLDPDEWELIKTHTLEGQRMLAGRRLHARGRPDRPLAPRALGRRRLSRRTGRRCDSARGADHLLLRRLERDADGPLIPARAAVRDGDGAAALELRDAVRPGRRAGAGSDRGRRRAGLRRSGSGRCRS